MSITTKPLGERYFKDVADYWAQSRLWDEFAAQAPCPFTSMNNCLMNAQLGTTPAKVNVGLAWLKKFETFKVFKRMTK